MLTEIAAVRLRELEIFEEVARARSVREVARRLHSTPGQVSKSIQRLEKLVGTKLFKRSAAGVLLTSQGTELHTIVQELLASGEKIESLVSNKTKIGLNKIVAIAGTSFLNTHFSTPVTCRLATHFPTMVFRFLDLAPDQIVAVGLRGGFDLAVYFGQLSWPGTWTTRKLGRSRWTLCARTGHPLAKRPSLKQILEYPFVVPTYWTAEGLVRGNDQFPIPFSKRRIGFETATADAAVPILLETDHLAFLPELLARAFVEEQRLRVLKIEEIPVVEKELFLSAKSDSVPAHVFEKLSESMKAAL